MTSTSQSIIRLLAVAATALCPYASPARAQVSGPVDYRTGDANNQIGSAGYNLPATSFVPNTGNLFITGNVTGGRSFRAFSPVRDSNTLWTGLPSSTLDNFRRDSMSLDTALLRQPPGTVNPYYSRQRTTSSLSTLSAGFERLGGLWSQDIRAIPQPTSGLTGRGLGQPYAGRIAAPGLVTQVPIGQTSSYQSLGGAFGQPIGPYAPLTRDVGSLFGSLPATPAHSARSHGGPAPAPFTSGSPLTPLDAVLHPEIVDLLSRAATLRRAGVAETRDVPDALSDRDQLTGRVLEPYLEFELPLHEGQEGQEGEAELPSMAAVVAGAATGRTGGLDETGLPLFAPRGDDLFADMVAAYDFVVATRERAVEFKALLAERPTLAGQYTEALSAARRIMEEPLDTFAGSGQTAVQQYLHRGEELFKAGQFYKARSFFERAEALDRRNPLPLMAQGHSMLAAGEYYSAAYKLSRAVELFPEIASFKMDLNRFITEPDLLEKRRADLERRLERKEDYRFRFVLGYAEYYSNLEKYGLENLRKAADLAPEGSGIARLYTLLTEGRATAPK